MNIQPLFQQPSVGDYLSIRLHDALVPNEPLTYDGDLDQTRGQFGPLRTLWINNYGNDGPIEVNFPDTGFSINCPANVQGYFPVLTNKLNFNYVSRGTVEFNSDIYALNFYVAPGQWGAIESNSGGSSMKSVAGVVESGETLFIPITENLSFGLMNSGGSQTFTLKVGGQNQEIASILAYTNTVNNSGFNNLTDIIISASTENYGFFGGEWNNGIIQVNFLMPDGKLFVVNGSLTSANYVTLTVIEGEML